MRRREFITLIGGAAAAWPLTANAQQPVPVIGFLRNTSLADSTGFVTAFRQGLEEAGFVEGKNVTIEYRWAENQPDRLPALVADLIRRPAAVIVGNTPSALAAKAATAAIPSVFVVGGDPIRLGLVASLNRPGGNATGVVFTTIDLSAKRLGLLHELVPKAAVMAALLDPNAPEIETELRDLEAAGRAIGRQILFVKAADERDFAAGFGTIVQAGAGGLLLGSGAFFFSRRRQLATMAARHALPAIGATRNFAEAGSLMSYGASFTDAYRRAGHYAGRILKGEKPGDLPVELASKFELVINLATAKGMGLDIPPMLLARADEVIE
jgi:putative ABC transport system substrate-binding protein